MVSVITILLMFLVMAVNAGLHINKLNEHHEQGQEMVLNVNKLDGFYQRTALMAMLRVRTKIMKKR